MQYQTQLNSLSIGIPSKFSNNNSYLTSASGDQGSPNSQDAGAKKKKGQRGTTPYIPSYMDLSNGPEPCVVCGDAATGYHYRCMTCEGCKGFFRRTIQKNLKYHCKWNGQCIIDKNTRNQCQQCRFNKCITVGMATDLVLNEKQRVAKRKLIEENRERRKKEMLTPNSTHPPNSKYNENSLGAASTSSTNTLSDADNYLISSIVQAFEKSTTKFHEPTSPLPMESEERNNRMWQHLAEVITPSIVKVVDFAKHVPGFDTLDIDDRVLLLKSCCMEVMCLRAACRYNNSDQSLTLSNGFKLYKDQLSHDAHHGVSLLMAPIFEFAQSISRLDLDATETALLAAILLMQSDRTGLKKPECVESVQETILGVFNRYVCQQKKHSLGRWATILMKVTDLRTISTKHAERVLAVKLDKPTEIPPFFFEMFDEGENNLLMSSLTPVSSDYSSMMSPVLHSPPTPSLFSPLGLQKIPSISDFQLLPSPILKSPIIKSPNLLTSVSPFWLNPGMSLPSLPVTPRTPLTYEFRDTVASLMSQTQTTASSATATLSNIPEEKPQLQQL